jgi:alcohol dehydrogenase (NADP+)
LGGAARGEGSHYSGQGLQMITVKARETTGPGEPFGPTTIERREVGPHDVLIDIAYTGICHSDVSHARSHWGHTPYPLVPGHEIAGIVSAVGPEVTRFAVGDRAGVGCMVGSCGTCANCRNSHEHQCSVNHVLTYGSIGDDGRPTQGGYSEKIVVAEDFVAKIPDSLSLMNAAPLLCAGITMYSPLRRWNAGPGARVGVLGFGGLGHIGVQIAKALGAHTTVLDLSMDKKEDALRLGADDYRATTDPATFEQLAESLDLIVSTVPTTIDVDAHLRMLAMNGTLVSLGVADKPMSVDAFSLIHNGRALAGSRIGGMAETREMLDFCGEHGIGAKVEVIDADRIDEAYDRLLRGDVRFRFVIDISTLANG